MNDERRNLIRWALAQITAARTVIEQVKDAEQEAFDAMPESFQEAAKGEAMQEGLSTLEDAQADLEGLEAALEEAFGAPTGKEKAPREFSPSTLF